MEVLSTKDPEVGDAIEEYCEYNGSIIHQGVVMEVKKIEMLVWHNKSMECINFTVRWDDGEIKEYGYREGNYIREPYNKNWAYIYCREYVRTYEAYSF